MQTLVKAAIINSCVLTINQIAMCSVKVVACNDEFTKNYHLTGALLSSTDQSESLVLQQVVRNTNI